jgi:hypothetical protein
LTPGRREDVIFGFEGGNNQLIVFTNGGDKLLRTNNNLLKLSQWYMVSLVLSGTTGYIYLNGVQVATGPLFHPQNIIRQNNYFGKSQFNWDAKLDAILDDMELYNVALSASDINAKYQSALSKGI